MYCTLSMLSTVPEPDHNCVLVQWIFFAAQQNKLGSEECMKKLKPCKDTTKAYIIHVRR